MNKKFLYDREGIGGIIVLHLMVVVAWTLVVIIVNLLGVATKTPMPLWVIRFFSVIFWGIGALLIWKRAPKAINKYLLSINDNDDYLRRLLTSDNGRESIEWHEPFEPHVWG